MFEALRKKFSSFLKKKKKPSKAAKKPSNKSSKKSKSKKKPEKKEISLPMKFNAGAHTYEPDIEKLKTPPKPEQPKKEEKSGFFSKLIKTISKTKLTKDQFDELFDEFEITLLENNVALEAADRIRESLSSDFVGKSIPKNEIENKVMESLKNSILNILIEPPDLLAKIKEKSEPYIIVFFGINGSGKTTSIAKLAYKLKQAGISSALAAGDTFRAASIEQLEKHAEKLDIKIIKQQYGSDPAAVAFDAKQYAKKNKIQAVLIDTAGRMYTKANLLKEMEKIIKVSKPDLKIFVGESITGNDATEQAKTFNESIGIDGIILSKADVDEKAGTILSVSHITGKPIYYLGVGQNYPDLKPFTKKDVLKNLGLE